MPKLRVGIIGGGIGGLAAAAALRQAGIEPTVFERAAQFGEVGAGIQMTPNAVKVMTALGLADELAAVSFRPHNLIGRKGHSGRVMWRTPLLEDCPKLYGAPFLHVHRADLHRILAARVPASQARLATACTGIEQTATAAVASFADGTQFEADVIIGADGIHSAVREALFGPQPARFTGHMCWRAVVPFAEPPLDYVSPDASFWLGPNGHVVTYYVQGGRAVNIVAVLETNDWIGESWTTPSTPEELAAGYKGWHKNLQKLFSHVETTFKWGLFDRDPMATWSVGRITLLGDAAHPMLPFLSQGAAMAIEDGFVLARALAAPGLSPEAALLAYQAERLPRTSRVQLEARERGRTYHLSSGVAQLKRDVAMRFHQLVNPHKGGIRANWVYEYDARKFEPGPLQQAA